MGEAAAEAFGLFVSSVEGRPVARFGAPGVFIGAERDPDNPRKLRYHTDRIIAIPRDELARYAREYARLVTEGDLVEHDAAEWQAQNDRDQQHAELARAQRTKDGHASTESGR